MVTRQKGNRGSVGQEEENWHPGRESETKKEIERRPGCRRSESHHRREIKPRSELATLPRGCLG